MGLTVGAIYTPLNDFFTALFPNAGPGSPVAFRFDQFGASLTPDDFRPDPTSPVNPALVREKISDLVNRVPLEVDAAHVQLSPDSIDDLYSQLLNQAQPYLPAGTTAQERQDLISGFSGAITEAKKVFEATELASVQGSPTGVHPTDTAPAGWWDPDKNDAWTQHTLTVTDTNTPLLAGPVCWRARPSRELLKEIGDVSPPPARQAARSTAPAGAVGLTGLRKNTDNDPAGGDGPADEDDYDGFRGRLAAMNAARRLAILRRLNNRVPTTPSTTTDVTISFEYCVVTLTRGWWTPWLTDPAWKIPGRDRGGFNGHPLGMRLLPIGFVAVRNVCITGSWSPQERDTARDAMSWGPFDITATTGTQTLTRRGTQLLAWMLLRLPELPPNPPVDGAPADPAQPARTYTVQKGDTLSRIAQLFYNDPTQYTRIQTANHLANPNVINVGQVLVIP